jgi:integrase
MNGNNGDILDLWLKGLKPATARNYGLYIRKLFAMAEMTPEEVVTKTKADIQTYVDLRELCNNFSESVRHLAVHALRSFLYAKGILMLPPARVPTPTPVKEETSLTWDQAMRIVDAMGKPYNLVGKMLLHCGWGISEFLKFNKAETWDAIKAYFTANPKAEYYRFNFSSRKKNRKKFYSLIPRSILDEILSTIPVPITASHGFTGHGKGKQYKSKGIVLDHEHFLSARQYIEMAFRTGLKRAPIAGLTGTPTPHELRDTYRTRAELVGVAPAAAEFSMGHTVDPNSYLKCEKNERWMWQNLSKIYGPSVATEDALHSRDEEIRRLQDRLRKIEEENSPAALDALVKQMVAKALQ